MRQRKRVALKYCGGCNPGYDRVAFFRRIREIAGDSIEWVTVEEPGFEALLLIQGCQTACPERTLGCVESGPIVSIRDDKEDPGDVVKRLLREREK